MIGTREEEYVREAGRIAAKLGASIDSEGCPRALLSAKLLSYPADTIGLEYEFHDDGMLTFVNIDNGKGISISKTAIEYGLVVRILEDFVGDEIVTGLLLMEASHSRKLENRRRSPLYYGLKSDSKNFLKDLQTERQVFDSADYPMGSEQVDLTGEAESQRIEAACTAFCESTGQTSAWPWREADFGRGAITAATFRTAMAEAIRAATKTRRTD